MPCRYDRQQQCVTAGLRHAIVTGQGSQRLTSSSIPLGLAAWQDLKFFSLTSTHRILSMFQDHYPCGIHLGNTNVDSDTLDDAFHDAGCTYMNTTVTWPAAASKTPKLAWKRLCMRCDGWWLVCWLLGKCCWQLSGCHLSVGSWAQQCKPIKPRTPRSPTSLPFTQLLAHLLDSPNCLPLTVT